MIDKQLASPSTVDCHQAGSLPSCTNHDCKDRGLHSLGTAITSEGLNLLDEFPSLTPAPLSFVGSMGLMATPRHRLNGVYVRI